MVDLRDEKILANIERLLNPQPILNPHIFADNGLMREDVRQQVLKQVDNFLSQNIKQLPGIDWEDAFLVGSSGSYFWKEDSDFDIWVKPKVDYKKFFIKNSTAVQIFLDKKVRAYKKDRIHQFKANNRKLDVKVGIEHLRRMSGVYSIVRNCWEKKPSRNNIKSLTKDFVYETVLMRKKEIIQVMQNFSHQKVSQIGFKELKQLTDFYDEILERPHKSDFEYIIVKLLKYDGIVRIFGNFCVDTVARVLSVQIPSEVSRQD